MKRVMPRRLGYSRRARNRQRRVDRRFRQNLEKYIEAFAPYFIKSITDPIPLFTVRGVPFYRQIPAGEPITVPINYPENQ